MLRRAIALAALVTPLSLRAQQPSIYVRTPGPGGAGVILRQALARPYIVRHEPWNTRLFRDSTFDSSVVVLASDATVASTVHGDVIVIDGNIFLRPGARIDGRALAFGGRVYDSEQATVRDGRLSFPDVRFDTTRTSRGIALDYLPPLTEEEIPGLLTLPMLYGLRIPSYTRVDGLGVPWGPRVNLARGRIAINPTVTYRLHIGAFDPALTVDGRLDTGWTIDAFGGRGTFTNDAWIEQDLVNSLSVLADGHDYRNYWRADRIEGRLRRTWTQPSGRLAVWAGARTERDWSITAGGPWSLVGRRDTNGIIRPNPAIERGRLSSVLAGIVDTTSLQDVTFSGALRLEQPFRSPRGEHFTQATIDLGVEFPTFGTQSFALRTHAVLTAGDTAPPQRFAYIGGPATLPTFDLLQFGGDDVLFIESTYNLPLTPIRLPFVGPPVLSLRHMIGSAGINWLPRFEQNVLVHLAINIIYAEYAIDPASRHHVWAVGLSSPLVR